LISPAIVIAAYSRPVALGRLLTSLNNSNYPPNTKIKLIIAIDKSEVVDVGNVARKFHWEHGEVEIILHDQHLGLFDQFLFCGDLSAHYDHVILLEDDLIVSPYFYTYASAALFVFGKAEKIAGISLYTLWFNGYTHHPFQPIADGADNFFLQIPISHGMGISADQWTRWREWLSSNSPKVSVDNPIHEMFAAFASDEWFPPMTHYLAATDQFFVYPRRSLSTNMGEAGTHFSSSTNYFQVPLQLGERAYTFRSFKDSIAVYDSFYEILPSRLDRLTDKFRDYDYQIDLNGTKSFAKLTAPYVLTTRGSKKSIFDFGISMRPLEANISHEIEGEGISFSRRQELRWGWLAELSLKESNYAYYTRDHRPSIFKFIVFWLVNKLRKLLRLS